MRIQLQNGSQTITARAAWAMAVPGRLRVELLNMLGQPMTSLASDGQFITIISHHDQSHYRFIQSRSALKRLIHLPIGIEELQALLAGRPPLPPYCAAQIDGQAIVLKNRWRTILAKLFLDETDQVQMLKVYDDDGALRYQVRWLQWQVVGPYTVPRRLQVDGGQGQRLNLTMDRFWADVQLSPKTFSLEPTSQIN